MLKILLLLAAILVGCLPVGGQAATKQVALSWCLPVSGKFQNGPAVNFRWSGGESAEIKALIEGQLTDTDGRIRDARSDVRTALTPSLGKDGFVLSGVINYRNLSDTDCSDPDETNSKVEFAVAIYERVILLVGNVDDVGDIQTALGLSKADALLRQHGSVVVKPGISLADLVAGDTRHRDFLKLSPQELKAWGPKMSYVIRYDQEVLARADFGEAGFADPKVAVEAGLERIAQMALGQVAKLGVVPGGSEATSTIFARLDGGLPDSIKPLREGGIGVITTTDGDLLVTLAVKEPLLKTEFVGEALSDAESTALTERFVQPSGRNRNPDDRVATQRFAFPTNYDKTRDEAYLEGQDGINGATLAVVGDAGVFRLATEPEIGPRFPSIPIEFSYSSQKDLRFSVGVDLAKTVSTGTLDELDFKLVYEDGHLSGNGKAAWRIAESWAGGTGDAVNLNLQASADTVDAGFGFPATLDISETRSAIEVSLTGSHDSMSQAEFQRATNPFLPTLGQARWYGSHEIGIRYQDVSFGGQDEALIPFAGGQVLGPFAEGRLTHSTFSPFSVNGAGNAEFALSYGLFWGLGIGGADSYFRGIADASARYAFSWPGERRGYVRLRGFAGAVDNNAPEYAFLDASAPKFFEGLGAREFMGRRVYGVTGEIGFDLSSLFGRLSKGQSAERDANGADESAGGDDQQPETDPVQAAVQAKQTIYLTGFASLGQVQDKLVAGVPQPGGETLESYGAKLVIRQVTPDGRSFDAELGVAYSPQSVVHESGVFFVGLSSAF